VALLQQAARLSSDLAKLPAWLCAYS